MSILDNLDDFYEYIRGGLSPQHRAQIESEPDELLQALHEEEQSIINEMAILTDFRIQAKEEDTKQEIAGQIVYEVECLLLVLRKIDDANDLITRRMRRKAR
jgi:hypothetical protein